MNEFENEPLVSEAVVAKMINLSLSWLRRDRAQAPNHVLPFMKIGSLVRYRLSSVQRAIDKMMWIPGASDFGPNRFNPNPLPVPPPAVQMEGQPRRGRGRPRKSEQGNRHA